MVPTKVDTKMKQQIYNNFSESKLRFFFKIEELKLFLTNERLESSIIIITMEIIYRSPIIRSSD